ncbi:hypothetical protein L6452_36280 [Arctium lappa]|uniref:Uncharacterized protein n=1 Tax=Arctium lappa TaxID=4217 RepID=A0ACB8Y9M1_ARCLA|nr:hypothetical protein L6452_36280 [Arctium lappa]
MASRSFSSIHKKRGHKKEKEEKLSTCTACHLGLANSVGSAAHALLHRLSLSWHERNTQYPIPAKMYDLRPKRPRSAWPPRRSAYFTKRRGTGRRRKKNYPPVSLIISGVPVFPGPPLVPTSTVSLYPGTKQKRKTSPPQKCMISSQKGVQHEDFPGVHPS